MQERFDRMRETVGAGFPGAGFPGGEEMRLQVMQLISIHRLLAIAVLAIFLGLLYWRVNRKGVIVGRALRSYLMGRTSGPNPGFLRRCGGDIRLGEG